MVLKDGDRIGGWLVGLFPKHHQAKAEGAGERAWQTLSSYLRGSAGVGLVEAVIIGLGLWVIGMPLVVPLAVLVFVGAFFPIIGILTAGGISAFIAIGSLGLEYGLIVLGLFLLVHLLEANVLYPVIAGQTLNLHPFAIMIVVAAASTVAGPIGAFLSIPVAAMTYAIASYLRSGEASEREAVATTG